MKITYLNPERVPLEKVPAGWMLKTALHPVKNSEAEASCTFITKRDLPPEYLFDFDGSGLSFDDPSYRAAVEKAWNEGKTIQYKSAPYWEPCDPFKAGYNELAFDIFQYRIHPKHAAEYGLSAEKIAMMEGSKLVPTPDLDDPEYWRARQPEIRSLWAVDTTTKLQWWSGMDKKWNEASRHLLHSENIYRPAPGPKSQEEIDDDAFLEWWEKYEKTDDVVRQLDQFRSWRAAIKHARKGGAK